MNRHQRRAAAKAGSTPGNQSVAAAQLLQTALGHYQGGRLADAAAFCQQALTIHPKNADALHLLGVVYLQDRQYDKAAGLIADAIKQNSQNPHYFSHLASALQNLNQPDKALECFRLAIQLKPDFVEAYNNRGNLFLKVGRPAEALESYEKAVAIKPDFSLGYYNAGRALKILQRPTDALANFDKALSLNPAHIDSRGGRIMVLQELHRFEEALEACDRGLSEHPASADLLNGRAVILENLSRFDEALACYEKAVGIQPNFLLPFSNRAALLQNLKRFEEALEACEHGLRHHPKSADLLSAKAVALANLARLSEALAFANEAIGIAPDFAQAFSNRAAIFYKLRKHNDAVSDCNRAIALDSSFAEAFYNRGNAYKALKNLDASMQDYERALQLKPDYVDALAGLGGALFLQNRFEEALSKHEKALAIHPDSAEGYNHRATVLHFLGRFDEAFESFGRAHALKPDFADAHWNEASLRLLTGDLELGWAKSEWRWKCHDIGILRREFAKPMWLGEEPLEGKTILIHNDQGLGDAIQFSRYIPMLASAGANVILHVNDAIRELLAGVPGVSRHLKWGEALPDFDLHCPMASLPHAFRTGLATIPASIPYIPVLPGGRAWASMLGPTQRPKVGLVWSGNPGHAHDHNRSIPVEKFLSLTHGVDATFVSLQKNPRKEDAEFLQLQTDILDPTNDIESFVDTAQLVSNLDLVISVDTSVAHLTGAIGQPVWILLPNVPDSRWLLDREDTPWYPTARLFRQNGNWEWDSVLQRVRDALMTFVSDHATVRKTQI